MPHPTQSTRFILFLSSLILGVAPGLSHSKSLDPPTQIKPLECARPFECGKETFFSDPPQAQDASTLQARMKSVPEAYALLEEYRKNREKSRLSAYTGTIGLGLLIFSAPLSRLMSSSDPAEMRKNLRLAGLSLAAGGFIYSFAILRTNELLIPRAVDKYNQARPDDPITLQFSTGWSF